VTDLDLIIDAARASGEIARRFWKKDPETWEKSADAGPVTEADLAIDTMLRHDLIAARPDYGWLSEETDDSVDRLDHETVFIVDPIDGTRAFIEGSDTFAHSIAVAHDGVVMAGAVYLPIVDLMFAATRNGVATLNGSPIGPSECCETNGATVLAHQRNYDLENWCDGVPEFDRQFRSSLAYRLCLVAQGKFDAMLTLRGRIEFRCQLRRVGKANGGVLGGFFGHGNGTFGHHRNRRLTYVGRRNTGLTLANHDPQTDINPVSAFRMFKLTAQYINRNGRPIHRKRIGRIGPRTGGRIQKGLGQFRKILCHDVFL